MRAFLWFLALILFGLAAIAALAYPAWLLVSPHFDFPFHRIANRVGMLALLIMFVVVARRLRVADRVSLGYGLAPASFLRAAAVALGLGAALMLPVAAAMWLLDLRAWKPGFVPNAATIATLAAKGLLSGIAVALIEETFLRGAMWSAIARESGARLATYLTAIVYAATHFIGRYRIPAEQVGPGSGVDLLAGSFAAFRDPAGIADAFLCLFAVGLVLGWVRGITGNIAACVGLHAGWVMVILLMRESSQPNPASPFAFLLSRFDGFVGWLVLAWTIAIGWWLVRVYRKGAQPARDLVVGAANQRRDAREA